MFFVNLHLDLFVALALGFGLGYAKAYFRRRKP
jgi:hypothetical protein